MARRGSENDGTEWLIWLDRVDEDEREEVATLIEAADMQDIPGVIATSQKILAAVARGRISIGVAREMREWVNLVYAQICTVKHPPDKADPGQAMLQAFFQPNTTINFSQPPKETAYARSTVIDADPDGKALDVGTLPGAVNE